MAIPFAFPSDEDTEANYQRLDQLLSDLYVVLQQILTTQRRIRDAQPSHIAHRLRNGPSNSRRTGEADTSAPSEPPRVLDTDFALQIASASTSSSSSTVASDHTDLFRLGSSLVEPTDDDRSPIRRRRRRRRTTSESSCCDETKNSGAEVAPTTTTPEWTQDDSQVQSVSEESKRPCDPADASLLSMLVPPPFGGSIWTAVLFVVGWRLARAR